MKALTGWDLKFFREALKLTVKGRASSVLRSSKTFEKAGIQLWEKNSKVQLAIRFNDEDKSPWLTASLSESTNVRTENNKVVLQDLIIQRGKTIQIKQMKASCDNQTSSMHKFTLTIFFRDFSNPNEFIDSWGRYKASVERTFSQSSGLT
ncbi:hypothetical protein MMC12_007068 [Toensbergia leucococca]|nr:hypothetical protein [Toensbergia leucococca]